MRAADKQSFQLILTEQSAESETLFSDFEFALFTLELKTSMGNADLWDMWKPCADEIATSHANHMFKTCLVGTKLDLISPGSAQDVALQCLPTSVAFYSRLKYISTSSVTGEGIHTVASFIG